MTDTCKDCDTPTSDFELSTHRGRCVTCFDKYGDRFKLDADTAFVNHVLILAGGDTADQALAHELRERYWINLTPREGSDNPDCGFPCLRASDIGLPGNGIAYPHPDCDLHGYEAQTSRPELMKLARLESRLAA